MNDAGPFRVLQVFAPGAFGGAESVVMTLSRGLAARGHALHAAATLGPAEPEPGLLARMRSAGVDVHVLRIPPRRYDRERRGLIDVARATNADVMHTHGYRSDLVGLSAARSLGLPIVSTIHGFTGGRWKNRWYERLQRSAWRRFDGIVAVSDPLARELRRVAGDALALHTVRNAWVPPGAPLPRAAARARLGLGLDEIVVGWVGRLTREKGCDLFLDAVARLEDLEVTFSIVGEGPERPNLRPRFAARERDGRLRWHGAIADAWAVMPAFDLLVLSSRTEGTPIVLLEAMHAAVPVVATAVGGVPDIVDHDAAWLVEPPITPDAIGAAIRHAVRDREARSRRAREARERLTALDPTCWLRRYEAIYAGVIASGGLPRSSRTASHG